MATPLHDRLNRILKKYGVSQEAWDEELDRINHHCPGCLHPFSTTRLPCVDHDHQTGMWRGILCTACNHLVGGLHDDSGKLRRLADYIDDPPAARYQMFKPGSIGEYNRDRDAEMQEECERQSRADDDT